VRIWRTIFLVILLSGGLLAAPGGNFFKPKPGDRWLAMDKLKHFSTSFYMTTTAFYGQNRIFNVSTEKAHVKAVGLTISLGMLKEIRDSRQKNNCFSWRDLAADILGSGAAILLLSRIE